MLLFSLFLTFITAHSAPIHSLAYETLGLDPSPYHPIPGRDLPQCPDPNNYRTTSGILWSCLATIFACTWSAVHPNLSGPRDSGFQQLRRRVVTMICVIIAPELLKIWDLRQRFAAARLKKEFNDQFHGGVDPEVSVLTKIKQWFTGSDHIPQEGWSLMHGFFVQMGGLMLYHNGKPVKVLTYKRMLASIRKGEIDIPIINEKDIADKNKGDFLTKLLVVGQTTWFVVQCIARWHLRLPLAELEVLTLGFAALNGIIYSIWWAKPQGVQEPIRLPLKTTNDSLHRGTFFHTSTDDLESKGSQSMEIATHNGLSTTTRGEATAPDSSPKPTEVNLDTVYINAWSSPSHHNTAVGTTSENPEAQPSCLTDDLTLNNHIMIAPCDEAVASKPAISKFSLLFMFMIIDSGFIMTLPQVSINISGDDHEGEMDEKGSFHLLRRLFRNARDLPNWKSNPGLSHFLLPITYLGAVLYFFASLLVRIPAKLTQTIPCRSHHGAEFFIVSRSRVPMFYADDLIQVMADKFASVPSIAIGIIFGAFHLTLWSSLTFPTFLSHELWKWSALFITVAPALILALLAIIVTRSTVVVGLLATAVYQSLLILYIVARCILIYLSFLTIFSLPEDVLQGIQWVDLIPHVN